MKQYLIETFRYNDHANRLVLEKIKQLPEKDESVKLFSHLINSMNKWLGRIEKWPKYKELDWWLPVYPLDEVRFDGTNVSSYGWILSNRKLRKNFSKKSSFTGLTVAIGQQ